MPTVNIYRNTEDFDSKLRLITPSLKDIIAKELSGASIKLNVDEVSIRLIDVLGHGMLAKVEVEISAAAFEERIKKQDEICLRTRQYLIDELNTDVKVWLILSELGHSWDNT
ncbi:MAG TPA: hypothetical protein VLF88_03650 [Candidatus Babeliales bacterium]|nr:hypothetical protein [Candidatus Babeliales bacterium]